MRVLDLGRRGLLPYSDTRQPYRLVRPADAYGDVLSG